VLAAGTGASASFAAVGIGLAVLAPALRAEYGLSLGEVGIVLASFWVGPTLTLLPWGLLADRIGERLVLATGLGGLAAALAAAAWAPDVGTLVVLIALGGAAGAGVNSATGRAVMHWFPSDQRGLALGIRQTAVPLGGLTAALALPAVERVGGLEAAFLFLAALCAAGALAGGVVVREKESPGIEPGDVPWTLRDGRLWLLCSSNGLYLVAQIAVLGFLVIFLHDEHGLSTPAAAGILAAVQVGAVTLRIATGRWSDRLGTRVRPLQRVGVAAAVTLAASAALVDAPLVLLVPAFVVAGSLAMAWNGLAFTIAAELAGPARSGAAIGFQQTVLSVVGVAVPPAFAATVSATSWRAAFALAAAAPLVGWWLLRPLGER
jgi:sugar phosphate permease